MTTREENLEYGLRQDVHEAVSGTQTGHVPSSGVGVSPWRSNQAAPAGGNIGSSMRSAVPTSKAGAAR